ncbi:MAG: TolC family protein [Verrucomicrobia bacterium]|nr:MAG: TolC family protein [Verrucomicrobiota bacterium]
METNPMLIISTSKSVSEVIDGLAASALSKRFGMIGPLALALLLTGCTGFSTPGERAARSRAETAAARYRPNGHKPTLPQLTATSSLRNFLTFALLNQPKVEVAYYDWRASIERITQARSLPDPQFTFQMDIQTIVTSVMPGLMGAIPWPDKLRVGADMASSASQAKYFAFQSAVLESAFDVKRSYYQLYFLDEKIHVNQDTLKLLAELEKLARSRNEVGKVTLQDVLRAQIEQDRLKTDVANLEDSRSSLAAQFKAALGLGGNDPMPPLPSSFESTSLDITADKLFKTALAQNTRLKAIEADVHAAEAGLILAGKSDRPDFSLGLMVDGKMKPTMYRPLGTVSLPIWRDKTASLIAEAQSNKLVAQAQLSGEKNALAVDIAQRTFLYREATRNLALLNDQILPKARQSLEVARSGYLADQIDFFNLTDTERSLLGYQLEKVEAAAQREIVLAELSMIIQGMPPANGSMAPKPAGIPNGKSATSRKTSGGM